MLPSCLSQHVSQQIKRHWPTRQRVRNGASILWENSQAFLSSSTVNMSQPQQIRLGAWQQTISIPFDGFAHTGGGVKTVKRLSSSQGIRLRHLLYLDSKGSSKCLQAGSECGLAAVVYGFGSNLRSPRSSSCNYCNFQQSDKWLLLEKSGCQRACWRREPVWSTSPVCLCAAELDGLKVYRVRLWFVGVQTDGGENSTGQVLNLCDGWCSSHNWPDPPGSLFHRPVTFRCL